MMLIGLDPGFSAFKAALWTPEGIKTAIISAQIGFVPRGEDMLSVGGVLRGRLKRAKRVSFEQFDLLVGDGVEYETEPLQRVDLKRLSEGPEPRALAYATFSALCEPGSYEARVLAALPVEVMGHKSMGAEFLHELRSWLVGEHSFVVNGGNYHLTVEDVRIFPQGGAAFFDWLLDERGQLAREKSALHQMIGVCDIGFRTVNFFTLKEGEVLRRFTGGNDAGIKTAAETLIKLVGEKYGIELSLKEADYFLRNPKEPLILAGKAEDISPLAAQALRGTLSQIITYADRIWGTGHQFARILLVGGGAKLLGNELKARFPHAELVPDPVFANARGLAKIAARRWLKDAEASQEDPVP